MTRSTPGFRAATTTTVDGSPCPRCGLRQPAEAAACLACGVVFAKLRAAEGPIAERASCTPKPGVRFAVEFEPSRTEREARQALIAGAAIAAVTLALPFPRFVFSYITVLVHELGHAACGWLFGYPSLPAFDFYYGGGLTAHHDRRGPLLVALYLGWAVLAWLYRRHPPGLAAVGVAAAAFTICAATPAHEALIVFMGHGSELLFAGLFFYRALSGNAVKLRVERPLYAFVALFIVASDLRFAWGLARSPLERELYGEAKGGGHWMDFSRLAHDLQLELTAVASFFLVCCLATLPLTWAIFRYRYALGSRIHRVFLDPWFPRAPG